MGMPRGIALLQTIANDTGVGILPAPPFGFQERPTPLRVNQRQGAHAKLESWGGDPAYAAGGDFARSRYRPTFSSTDRFVAFLAPDILHATLEGRHRPALLA